MSEHDQTGLSPEGAPALRTGAGFIHHDAEALRGRSGDHRHEHRGADRGHASRGVRTGSRDDRQAALVDARFWAWLHDEDAAGAGTEAAREILHELVHQHGGRMVRTLWYSDQDSDRGLPGLQVRRVPSNAQDQGVTMLRAMAQDLAALAEHRAVDRVLIISDDDRLLLAIDEAQRRGLMVDMLVDRESQDLKALSDDEPHWATLLQQADRLLVLGSPEVRARGFRPRSGGQPEPRVRREPPSAQASGIIEDEILTWWDDETPDQRDHWRQEVQAARGIPQELDRQLLLRISRRLGQPLSPAEKSAMRQQVREQVLGGADAAAGAMRTPEDA